MFGLLNDYPARTLATLFIVAFIAALARGFSGFGAALIFIPTASALIGPTIAAPLLLIADGLAALGLIPGAWKPADKRDVATMSLGCLVGAPAGVALLIYVDALSVRWTITIGAVVLFGVLVSGWRYRGRASPVAAVAAGAVAGLASGLAQMGGPPAVAYWLSGAIAPRTIRANLVIYFTVSSCFSGLSYFFGGLFTEPVLLLAVIVTPIYGAGLWLGSRLFPFASETVFRRICYGLIVIAIVTSAPTLDSLLR